MRESLTSRLLADVGDVMATW